VRGVRDLAANGYKEIVLTGIHLGAYGLDLPLPTTLTALVHQIDAESIVPRLRIGSVEPNEVSDELLNMMADSKRICPHLHIPLQSGSDLILKRMGRLYTADVFRELIVRISTTMPDAFIGADVIAGFPGETEAEFNETVHLLEELPFSDLHVFPYSRRPGTRAASMPGHVPSQLITERAAHLRNIAKLKKKLFLERVVHKEIKVLVQGYNVTSGLCNGLSRNYISVSFPGDISLVNAELSILITGTDGVVCTGIPVVPKLLNKYVL
jgi:threonylcarbamoyladenosine tRNA methylthiotransferase MtaB